jgi:hypothetical protein
MEEPMAIMSLDDWKDGTRLSGKIRSLKLRSVDSALSKYVQTPSKEKLEKLIKAFSEWAGIKEGKYWQSKKDSAEIFLSSRNKEDVKTVDLLWDQIKQETEAYRETDDDVQNGRDYEPGFFLRKNIIGYTGDPTDYPTVYFSQPPVISLVASPEQLSAGRKKFVRYSHITQKHSLKTNVGRGILEECCDYRIVNTRFDDHLQLQEYVIGRTSTRLHAEEEHEFHTSRNQFMPAHGGVLDELARAIDRYRFLKNYDARIAGMGLQPEPNLVQDDKGDWYSP